VRDGAVGRTLRGPLTGFRGRGGGYDAPMADPVLITVEMRIRTTEDPKQLGDRLRESASTIVGREALEEFRVRVLPLVEKRPRSV
jgi:hypothetical protein